MRNYKIAVAGTGYVGLSLGVLLSQHHQVVAVDIVQAKVDMINNKKSPIQDDYIEKYLAEKDLNLTATLDAKAAYAHRNLAFIGPAGTGKTHLAQAFGYECCQQGLKTYFIKASELRDKLTNARKAGKTASCLNSLVRPSCLIIDEIGHCEFDRENTRLFFDLVDRRYNKEGSFNTVFTSNKNPARWRDIFNEDDALLCAFDRIFDDAEVFKIRGESFRVQQLVTISFQTSRVKEFNPTEAEVK